MTLFAAVLVSASASAADDASAQESLGPAERGVGLAVGGGLGLSVHAFQALDALDAPEWQVRAEVGFETAGSETIDGDGTSGMLVGESVDLAVWALRLGLSLRRYVTEELYLSAGGVAVRRAFDLEESSSRGSTQVEESRWSLDVPLKAGVEFGRPSKLSIFFEGGWILRQDDEILVLPIDRYALNYGLPSNDWTIGAGFTFGL